jgi:hypothetical protein
MLDGVGGAESLPLPPPRVEWMLLRREWRPPAPVEESRGESAARRAVSTSRKNSRTPAAEIPLSRRPPAAGVAGPATEGATAEPATDDDDDAAAVGTVGTAAGGSDSGGGGPTSIG